MDPYANAVGAEPNRCWRMVGRPPGPQVGSPTDCEEPVVWVGQAVVGKKRMRLWSCAGHLEGLEDLPRAKEKGLPGPEKPLSRPSNEVPSARSRALLNAGPSGTRGSD
jgi:hypothetical protein